MQLEYPQNSLLLDVTAISSRTFPEQFQYAFALYDSGGKVIREKLSRDSQFAMEGLQPGSYRVVARAFTKDLLPATPLKFDFSVAGAPFPWTTTALAVLLVFALIALTWAAIEHRRSSRPAEPWQRPIANWQARACNWPMKRKPNGDASRAICTTRRWRICESDAQCGPASRRDQ